MVDLHLTIPPPEVFDRFVWATLSKNLRSRSASSFLLFSICSPVRFSNSPTLLRNTCCKKKWKSKGWKKEDEEEKEEKEAKKKGQVIMSNHKEAETNKIEWFCEEIGGRILVKEFEHEKVEMKKSR